MTDTQLNIPGLPKAETKTKKGWTNCSAMFSKDRAYRYWLFRGWDDTLPLMMFIGLNPSTANEDEDDPTIRRVVDFAKSWGYGGVYMMNLYAIVSSDPKVLLTCEDPLGKNDQFFDDISKEVDAVLFAWGAFKVNGRDEVMKTRFPNAYCLGVNKNGSPKHPLYVPGSMKLTLYKENKPVK